MNSVHSVRVSSQAVFKLSVIGETSACEGE